MAEVPRILQWPETLPGRGAVYAILIFFFFMILFYGLALVGEQAGETFFSNLALAVPILCAGVSGIVSAVLSGWALFIRNERKLVLVMSLTVGVFTLVLTVGEILGHG